MLKLKESDRDQITNYLANIVVPARVGADITQIVSLLSSLEIIEEKDA